jgi:hypothetical protein
MAATNQHTLPAERVLNASWQTLFREGKVNRGLDEVEIPVTTENGQVGLALTRVPAQGFYSTYFSHQIEPLKISMSPDLTYASERSVKDPAYVSDLPELRQYVFAYRYNERDNLYTLWTLDDHYTRQ